MAFTKPTMFTSWSYSRWRDYEQCPRQAKLKHLDKVQEPLDPAGPMARGSAIGKSAELFIKGGLKKLPPELKTFAKDFKEFRELFARLNGKGKLPFGVMPKKSQLHPMTVEDTWAFTKGWTATTWNDWVGCWVRIKVDCAHEVKGAKGKRRLVVTDFKTGKFRPEQNESYVQQLELYALGALLHFPLIDEVEVRLMYTDAGVIFPAPPERLLFSRADVPKLKGLWDKRTRKMLLDKSFSPKPNDKCRWCWYRAENTPQLPGGKQLCQF